eukprot:2006180-Rhodomonas_salina.1
MAGWKSVAAVVNPAICPCERKCLGLTWFVMIGGPHGSAGFGCCRNAVFGTAQPDISRRDDFRMNRARPPPCCLTPFAHIYLPS